MASTQPSAPGAVHGSHLSLDKLWDTAVGAQRGAAAAECPCSSAAKGRLWPKLLLLKPAAGCSAGEPSQDPEQPEGAPASPPRCPPREQQHSPPVPGWLLVPPLLPQRLALTRLFFKVKVDARAA